MLSVTEFPDLVPRAGAALLPGGHGDFGQSAQHDGLLQPDEGNERALQEIHLPHQHVGGLGIAGQLLHEFVLQLRQWEEENYILLGKQTGNMQQNLARFHPHFLLGHNIST